jgi:small-conductance mechanosensitive channel
MDLHLPNLDSPFVAWLSAIALASAINLAVLLAKGVALRVMRRMSTRTVTSTDDAVVAALGATRQWLILPVSLYVGALLLDLPVQVAHFLHGLAILSTFCQVALWAAAVLAYYLERARSRAVQADVSATTGLAALAFISRVGIWSLAALLALTNLGVDVTAFVAGLGVGGIAVALAVQNILGDLFASLSIVLDKPFMVGDFIVIDDYMGTVEQVGLKTTRIRSLSGEQLIFSNGDLLKARMRNYKRMRERRVSLNFGVLYQTSPKHLSAIPEIGRRIIESTPGTRFDRAHLMRFGESSLDFEVVYWVLDPDYNRHMDIQQTILLELIRIFAAAGIEFAYPTRTVVLEGTTRLKLSMSRPDSEASQSELADAH